MAFSKAKLTRFNDIKTCSPAPGAYNPNPLDLKAKSDNKNGNKNCLSNEQPSKSDRFFNLFRTPSVPAACRKKLNLKRSNSATKLDNTNALERATDLAKFKSETNSTENVKTKTFGLSGKSGSKNKICPKDQNNELIKTLENQVEDLNQKISILETIIKEKEENISEQIKMIEDEKEKLILKYNEELKEMKDQIELECEKYNELVSEKDELQKEINSNQQQIDQIQFEKQQLMEKIDDLEKSCKHSIEECKQNHAEEISQLQIEIKETRNEIKCYQNVCENLELEKIEMNELLKAKQLEIERLESLNSSLEDQIKSFDEKIQLQETIILENSKLKEDYFKIEKDLFEKETMLLDLDKQLEQLKIDHSTKEAQLKEANEHLLKDFKEKSQTEIDELNRNIERLNEDIVCLKEKIKTSEDVNDRLKFEIDSIYKENNNDLEQIRKEFEDEIEELKRVHSNEIIDLKMAHKLKLKDLNKLKQDLENSCESLKQHNSELNDQIKSINKKLNDLRIDKEHEFDLKIQEIEQTYKKKLAEQEINAKEVLKECQTISEYNIIQSELEKKRILMNLKSIEIERNHLIGIRRKNEDDIKFRKFIINNLNQKVGILNADLRRERKQSESRIKQLKTDLDKSTNELKHYQMALNETSATLDVVKKRLLESDEEVIKLKSEIDNLEKINSELMSQTRNEVELNDYESINSVYQDIINIENHLNSQVELYKNHGLEQIKKIQKEKHEIITQRDEAMEQLKLQKDKMKEAYELIQMAKIENERTNSENIELEFQLKRFKSQQNDQSLTDNDKIKLERLVKENESMKEEILQLDQQNKNLAIQCKQTQLDNDKLNQQVSDLENLITPFRECLEEYRNELKMLQEKNMIEDNGDVTEELTKNYLNIIANQNQKQCIKHFNEVKKRNLELIQEKLALETKNRNQAKMIEKLKQDLIYSQTTTNKSTPSKKLKAPAANVEDKENMPDSNDKNQTNFWNVLKERN